MMMFYSARNVEKSQEMARIHLENAEKTLMAAMSERKDGGDISKLAEKKKVEESESE